MKLWQHPRDGQALRDVPCGMMRSVFCLAARCANVTDQGSQLAGAGFTGLLPGNAIAVSMHGRGARCCNVFIERLWRSVRYEEVHLRAYGGVGEARASVNRYLAFHNRKRPHSSLDARTPDQADFDHPPQRAAA